MYIDRDSSYSTIVSSRFYRKYGNCVQFLLYTGWAKSLFLPSSFNKISKYKKNVTNFVNFKLNLNRQ